MIKENKVGKIYILKDPCTDEIRYVGQTIQSLESRMKTHIWDSLYRDNGKYNIPKCNWMRKLILEERLPVVVEIESVDKTLLNDREVYWIKHFKSIGCKLLNLTAGGTDMCGKIKEYQKFIRPVYAISRSTLERFEFLSIEDASIKTNTKRSNIPKAIYCRGECNGFFWSYEEFKLDWVAPISKNFRKIKLINIETNQEYEFKMKKDALLFTGGNMKSHHNGMDYALTHENKEYRGYLWSFID